MNTALTLEARKDCFSAGKRTRFWTILRNGKEIAQLSKGSEAFAKYRVLAGPVYRNDFTNREAALAFAATL
ncbi:MAG: hypothetical protein EKK41_23255 [Hyphomicrobiales bacterium]|nr:MAG: hypothetical protein EKK41_23255 [Hyphomicrobiales bacterium]